MSDEEPAARLAAVEWVAAAIAMVGAAGLFYFGLVMAPALRRLLGDFGSALPRATVLALSPGLAPGLALLVLALVALGVVRPRWLDRRSRALLLAASALLVFFSLSFSVLAGYLPLLQLGDHLAP
jgi:hypothetical protein